MDEMPVRGITPYPYNHKNWVRNVKYWNAHPRIDDRDVTEVMIEELMKGKRNDQDTELPKDSRGKQRPY